MMVILFSLLTEIIYFCAVLDMARHVPLYWAVLELP